MKKNKWQNPLISLVVASFLVLLVNAASENQEKVKDVSLSTDQTSHHASISLSPRVTKKIKDCSLASVRNKRLRRMKQLKYTTFVCPTSTRRHPKTTLVHRSKNNGSKKHQHNMTSARHHTSKRHTHHHTSKRHAHHHTSKRHAHHHTKHVSSRKHTSKKHVVHKHVSKSKTHGSKKHAVHKHASKSKSHSSKKHDSKKHNSTTKAHASNKHATTKKHGSSKKNVPSTKKHTATTTKVVSTTTTFTTTTSSPTAALVKGAFTATDIAIDFLATPTPSATPWTVTPLETTIPNAGIANGNKNDGSNTVTDANQPEETSSDNNQDQTDDSNEDSNEDSDSENNEDDDDHEVTAFSSGSGAADISLNQPTADKSATASAQDVNGQAIEATAQSKVIGISVGAIVGCLAAAGLVGMFMYRRHQKNHQEQDMEEMDAQSEVNTRYRTQSFMAVVAGTVAKLPTRSDSSSSKKSVGVLGSLRRAASRSLGRSNSTSSTQSYDHPAQFYGADSPTGGPGHTHAY
ncbi:hypothetical protein BD560DRAFT_423394 [Blakeslea trispora]|nr:hypothetical protein BD560DRAFT_423394 [Blakeslea trispora]